MFSYQEKVLYSKTFQFKLYDNNKTLSYRDVVDLWENSDIFREFYTQVLLEVPFRGFFWENKPVSNASLDEHYEFIVRGTSAFDGKLAHANTFEKYFEHEQDIVAFDNLSGDARLVVPVLKDAIPEHYAHLGPFIRNAKSQQIHQLWIKIAQEFKNCISPKPLWLSTSGLGVFWLHIRFDTQPKYYVHRPYRFLDS